MIIIVVDRTFWPLGGVLGGDGITRKYLFAVPIESTHVVYGLTMNERSRTSPLFVRKTAATKPRLSSEPDAWERLGLPGMLLPPMTLPVVYVGYTPIEELSPSDNAGGE